MVVRETVRVVRVMSKILESLGLPVEAGKSGLSSDPELARDRLRDTIDFVAGCFARARGVKPKLLELGSQRIKAHKSQIVRAKPYEALRILINHVHMA